MKTKLAIALCLAATKLFALPPGTAIPGIPHVVAGQTEGSYFPSLGYVWVSDDPDDFRVEWKPRMFYEKLHILTSQKEGLFVPQPGYRWKTAPDDTGAIGIAEVAAGLAAVGAVIGLSERLGKDLDRWLPEKGPSQTSNANRDGSRDHGNHGGQSWGRDTHGARSTGPRGQDRK